MSKPMTTTDRRSFLKTGALVAAPLAVLAPAAAIAADDSAAKLARIEDERAIEGLMRGFLRRFNGKGNAEDCGQFIASAGAIRIDPQVRAIREDARADAELAFADDGHSARWTRPAEVELLANFAGQTTLEKMARFQGQGSARSLAKQRIEAEFVRVIEDGSPSWTITRLMLA